ncbi:MAG: rod shape-determining protein MreC [Acidimicrobiales bacterium]
MLQHGGRPRYVLALLILTAITLATLDARGFGPVEAGRSAVGTVLSPIGSAVGWVLSPVSSGWNGIWGYRDLEDENAELRARLAELEGTELRETTAREVLERIMVQSDLTYATDVPQVLARVVGGPVNNFEETVTIDKGSADGIREGMAVVTGAGLVGRVDRVTENTAVVQLISDTRLRVGARLVGSGAPGLVEGRGRGRSPELEVSGTVELADGELLETSGLSGSVYPPDIPIGRIRLAPSDSADDDATTSTTAPPGGGVVLPDLDSVVPQRVTVELAADLDRLGFLTVLLWEPAE